MRECRRLSANLEGECERPSTATGLSRRESQPTDVPDYEIHSIRYDGTTTEEWEAPQRDEFDTDDLSEIDDHFLLSESGFPPDDFTDLQLPVVDPDGNLILNLNALQTAYSGGHSVEQVEDIDDQTVGQAKGIVQSLAEDAFGHEIGD